MIGDIFLVALLCLSIPALGLVVACAVSPEIRRDVLDWLRNP